MSFFNKINNTMIADTLNKLPGNQKVITPSHSEGNDAFVLYDTL